MDRFHGSTMIASPMSCKEHMMAKYLLLKHYRGAPAPINDVPMDQWTPEELAAHVQSMQDFAARLEAPASSSTVRRSPRTIGATNGDCDASTVIRPTLLR